MDYMAALSKANFGAHGYAASFVLSGKYRIHFFIFQFLRGECVVVLLLLFCSHSHQNGLFSVDNHVVCQTHIYQLIDGITNTFHVIHQKFPCRKRFKTFSFFHTTNILISKHFDSITILDI